MNRDEQADLKRVAAVMTDDTPIKIVADVATAWIVVANMQYVWRDERLSPAFRDTIERVGRLFQQAVTDHHPEIADLIEKGWDTNYDVEQ